MGRGVVEVQSNEVGGGLAAGSAGSRWTTVRFEAWRDHVTSRPFSARLRCCDWRCSNSADATGDGRNVQNKALKQNLHPFKPSKNRSKETKNKQKKNRHTSVRYQRYNNTRSNNANQVLPNFIVFH